MKKNLLLTTAIVSFAFIGTAAAAAAESPKVLEGDIQSSITAQSIVNAGTTVNGTNVMASNVSSDTYGAVIVQRSKEGTPPESNGTLNLTGGTFSNNTAKKGDGGAISNYGNLNVNGTTFTDNLDHTASDAQDSNPIGGGAIALGVDSVTNIENATFTHNKSGFRGGAIATRRTLQEGETGTNGSLTIKDSTFEKNMALVVSGASNSNSNLAAGLGGAVATNFNTEVTGGTFKGNFAEHGGGAIYLTGFVDAQNQTNVSDDKKAGNLTVTGTTFDSNTTFGQGGAILTGTNSQKLTVNDATFTKNSAQFGGGAIWSGSETEINGGSFTNNSTTNNATGSDLADGAKGVAEGGGAIFVGGESKVTIDGTTFTDNKSGTVGGAIATRVTATITDGSSSLDISNATFEGNSAKVAGGAISVGNEGIAPEITNSTFTNNTSATGGAIYNKGNLTVTGGSFSGNAALVSGDTQGVGGAIANSKGTLTVTDVAFSGNHSTHGGGAIYSNGSKPLTVKGGSFENNIAGYTSVGEEAAAAAVAVAEAATKGGNGGAIFAGEGTTLSVEGTTFSGNQAIGSNDSGFGGAISSAATNATVKDATFENNQASVAGGAINATEKGSMTVTNGTFTGNSSNNGGAVYNKGTLTVDGGSFTNNSSTGVGGAVTNSGGTLTVKEATFEGNRAATTGGAIYTNGSGKEVKIEDSSFTNNEAGYSENGEESGQHNGGAIFAGQGTTLDVKKVTFEGNKASGDGGAVAADNTSTFEDVTFANNTAGGNGGALSITGTSSDKVTFKGNVAFENNTAADGVQNDIHFGADNGSILVDTNATLSLDGGISCANGSCSTAKVEMGQNSTLNVYDDTKVATKVAGANGSGSSATNDFDINVKLNAGTNSFDLANIFTQEGNASDLTDNVVTDNNNLFTITNEEGTVFAVQERSAAEVASNLGVSGAEAETVLGVMRAKTDNPNFAKVQKALGDLAQSETVDSNVISRAADALGADAAPVVRTRETMLTNTIFEAANDAMDDNISAMIAQSQTHTLIDKVKFWVKGLFNYADKHDTAKAHGFDIDTYGVAMGIDKEVGAGKVGLGYAYNKSDIDGYTRKTDAKTNSLFLYGKYNPADWYVKGVASYNWSNYKEKKTVLGENADSKYDVNTLALEGLYGYNLHVANGLDVTPEAGLRYIHAKQDASTNALGVRVNARNLDVLTAVAGVKVAKNFTISNGINIRPEARAALTYDLTTNDDDSIVSIPGGATYVVNGEKLERVGYELGAKVATDITSRFEIAAGYEARIRKDYVDHTGMLSAKYKF